MTLPWITSTALVALLVASIVFPWQKEVEHTLHLRKEKFDLFRKFLAQAARAVRLCNDKGIHANDTFVELECLAEEIAIISFGDAAHASNKFVANLAMLNEETDGDEYFSAKDVGDLRSLLNDATVAMREDIRQTRPWPLGKRYEAMILRIDK